MKQSGLSTRQLAEKAGTHHSKIDHLLAGRQKLCREDVAVRIAGAVDAPLHLLWFETESESQAEPGSL
jgi:plasmid maintenance system antidote protein VapI